MQGTVPWAPAPLKKPILRTPFSNRSPLRDGNRDRLIGLLTERAAKTLMVGGGRVTAVGRAACRACGRSPEKPPPVRPPTRAQRMTYCHACSHIYLMEINPTHYSWLLMFYQKNPIPKVRTRAGPVRQRSLLF